MFAHVHASKTRVDETANAGCRALPGWPIWWNLDPGSRSAAFTFKETANLRQIKTPPVQFARLIDEVAAVGGIPSMKSRHSGNEVFDHVGQAAREDEAKRGGAIGERRRDSH
jgi:hypothetical protein